ncbi:MAG: hypothetical protein NTV43_04725 [Methylococcales bacterium]|nr:hypothetical protein [Methylococcales bacterium]
MPTQRTADALAGFGPLLAKLGEMGGMMIMHNDISAPVYLAQRRWVAALSQPNKHQSP